MDKEVHGWTKRHPPLHSLSVPGSVSVSVSVSLTLSQKQYTIRTCRLDTVEENVSMQTELALLFWHCLLNRRIKACPYGGSVFSE